MALACAANRMAASIWLSSRAFINLSHGIEMNRRTFVTCLLVLPMIALVASVATAQEQLKPFERIVVRESEDGAQFVLKESGSEFGHRQLPFLGHRGAGELPVQPGIQLGKRLGDLAAMAARPPQHDVLLER